jgi:monoamine oxidase
VFRHTPENEEIGQDVDDIRRLELPVDPECRPSTAPRRWSYGEHRMSAGHKPTLLIYRVICTEEAARGVQRAGEGFDFSSFLLYQVQDSGAGQQFVMQTTVVIVGGGLSGLYAARYLQQVGIDFQLLEARERFGGRILSADASGQLSPDSFDLGPSWFWPGMHPRMAGIVQALGIRSFPQHSDGDVVLERSRSEAPQRFPAMRQEPLSMRFIGGTGALVSALVHALPRERLHLGHRVTRITMRESDVTLSVVTGGEDREVAAMQVILALPPRLLESTISFEPALENETLTFWSQTATWMAPHAKFFALYDQAFWRGSGLSGTAQSGVGPLVEIHDATTASGAAALFGFVGLNRGQRLAIGEETLVRASVAQLARLFGDQAARPWATLIKDWAADLLTSTDADQSAEGHPVPSHGPWVSGVWAQRMSLAGSETSATDPGYLAGALDAAERATDETLARLGRPGRSARVE